MELMVNAWNHPVHIALIWAMVIAAFVMAVYSLAKLGGSIGTNDLDDLAVTSAKLADDAVTPAKLQNLKSEALKC